AILVLVLAVLTVSYASSMRAYLHQRAHIAAVKEQIAERAAAVKALEREKRRWDDPVFVQAQARKRFGYVMPGETGIQVIDVNGRPLGTGVRLPEPAEGAVELPPTWWEATWASVELAGHPPPPAPELPDVIVAPQGQR
ncbi:MAG: septum formation initiator family protein, partial [Nocardioides sp.]